MKVEQVTQIRSTFTPVVWSPDGRRLALLIDRARRRLEIRILDVVTGHVRKMVLASSYAPTYDFSDLAWLHVRI